MVGHIRRAGRFFAAIVTGPFAFGFVSAWLPTLGFLLILFGGPMVLGCLVVGGIMFTMRGVKTARQFDTIGKRVVVALAAPIMTVATAALAWPSLAAGSDLSNCSRLLVNQSHYEAIIAKARRGEHPAKGLYPLMQDAGVAYLVDDGSPVRVAFNPEGFLDNWSGIIFDPTGKVALADGFDPVTEKFAAPDEITKLFRGDLVVCQHLWAAYYRCTFT